MDAIRRMTEGKQTVLYPAKSEGRPLIVCNHFSDDTDAVAEAFRSMGFKDRPDHPAGPEDQESPDINLLFIFGLDWEHDMTPWECPPLRKGDRAFTGGADEYLGLLLERIIPEAKGAISGIPSYTGIAGYSLAGLFSIYALYNSDAFDRAASMSGSVWYPGFREYVFSHKIRKNPDRIYMSLGDKEGKTKEARLKTVRDNTEAMVRYFGDIGIPVTFELNPGNHFTDAAIRCARGIISLTR